MKVLLINPSKKKKSKKSKRSVAMAKKKRKTRKKTTAVATVKVTTNPKKRRRKVKRRKVRARRNPAPRTPVLLNFAIGGVTGLATAELVDRIKPMNLPYGLTGGDLASIAAGYLLVKKGRGTIREIGKGHIASAMGKAIYKVIRAFQAPAAAGTEGLENLVIDSGYAFQPIITQELSEANCCGVQTL